MNAGAAPFLWADLQREQYAAYRSSLRVPGRPQYGRLPVVTRFAGRRWVLDDDAQSLIFGTSNRYTFRHDEGYGHAYAYQVRLLADKLRTDVTTAGRLARWMCPDGCTVIRTGPRVLYRMTRAQEHRWRRVNGERRHVDEVNAIRARAAGYLAAHGHNEQGPYICRGCGARRLDGNGWDHNGRRPLATDDGVRRRCGVRCLGPDRTRTRRTARLVTW